MSALKDIRQHTSSKSKAFPTTADVAAWEALSAAEQRAIVLAEEEAGFNSGVAPQETAAEHLARIRAQS